MIKIKTFGIAAKFPPKSYILFLIIYLFIIQVFKLDNISRLHVIFNQSGIPIICFEVQHSIPKHSFCTHQTLFVLLIL